MPGLPCKWLGRSIVGPVDTIQKRMRGLVFVLKLKIENGARPTHTRAH